VSSENVAKFDFHSPHYTYTAILYLTNNLVLNTVQNYINRTVCYNIEYVCRFYYFAHTNQCQESQDWQPIPLLFCNKPRMIPIIGLSYACLH